MVSRCLLIIQWSPVASRGLQASQLHVSRSPSHDYATYIYAHKLILVEVKAVGLSSIIYYFRGYIDISCSCVASVVLLMCMTLFEFVT